MTGLSEVREKLKGAINILADVGRKGIWDDHPLAREAVDEIVLALALMESEQGELVERIAVELYSAWSDGQVNGAGGGLTHEWDEIGDDQTGWLDTARAILGTESENGEDK